jgi:hypothetical protein
LKGNKGGRPRELDYSEGRPRSITFDISAKTSAELDRLIEADQVMVSALLRMLLRDHLESLRASEQPGGGFERREPAPGL